MGYVEKKDCNLKEIYSFKQACQGGFSSTQVGVDKYFISFERNHATSVKRAADLAILRCSSIAIENNRIGVKFDFVERGDVVSIDCYLSKSANPPFLNAKEINTDLKSQYDL